MFFILQDYTTKTGQAELKRGYTRKVVTFQDTLVVQVV